MFSRLKQKVESSTSGTEPVQSKLIITSAADVNSNSKLEKKKSIDDSIALQSNNSSSHYQSSSDETSDKSESIHSRNSPPHLETNNDKPLETTLPAFHLISKLDTFKKTNNQYLDKELIDSHENIISENYRNLNVSLLSHIEILNNEIMEKTNENDTIRAELSRINTKYEILEYESENYKELCNKLEAEIRDLKNEKDDLIIKNADLSQKYELLKLVNNKPGNILSTHGSDHGNLVKTSYSLNDHKRLHDSIESNQQDLTNLSNKNNKEYLQQQLDENKLLRDDLNEKNKLIKNLQQRLNDMKKTLQRELKYQSLPNESKKISSLESVTCVNTPSAVQQINSSKPGEQTAPNFTPLLNSSAPPQSTQNNHQLQNRRTSSTIGFTHKPFNNTNNNAQLSHLHDDVNFKYLKHVVLKFLTSREYEAIHLVKAVSVLLNFTNEEEKILKETLEWKMSWFGSRPRV